MSIHRKAQGIWCSIFVGSVAVAMGIGGCEQKSLPPPPPSLASLPSSVPEKLGCNGGAFAVKLKNSSSCDDLATVLNPPSSTKGWHVEALCGGKPNLPIALQGYCALTWNDGNGASQGAPDAKALLKIDGVEDVIEEVQEDCVATAPQGGADPNVASAEAVIHEKFRLAAGFPPSLSNLMGIDHGKSFVVALDTLPHEKVRFLFNPGQLLPIPLEPKKDPYPFGQDDHGWTVLALVDDLTSLVLGPVGTQPTKVAELDARLVLPSVDHDNIDEVDGGSFGRTFHLANGICKAIDDWEAWRTKQPVPEQAPAPVVVMALGSLPVEGQQCDSIEHISESMPNKVVFAAMQHAACHGAALVAAAGNDPNGKGAIVPGCSEVPGPTCPGGMSKIQVPTPDECDKLYFPSVAVKDSKTGEMTDPYVPSDYHLYEGPLPNPLVHVISAVDAAGVLIPETREGSRSKLAAVGTLGAAQDTDGVWHMARTGTSISSAVAAAGFANLFAYRPKLTAAEAADILYRSALDSPDSAPRQFADDDSDAPVKMISICEAIELALNEAPERALNQKVQLGCQGEVDSKADMIVNDADVADALATKIVNAIPLSVDSAGVGTNPSSIECTGNPLFNDPAPGSTKCNDCGYLVQDPAPGKPGSKGQAFITLAGGNQVALSKLTLVLRRKDSEAKEIFVLENFGFAPGSSLALNGITSDIAINNLRSVTFEAIVENGTESSAVTGEIPIVHHP